MTEWWSAADDELLHALSASQQRLNAAHREMLELVAEIHARQLGGVHGFSTDIDLLRCTQNVTKSEARLRIMAARDVLPARTVTGEPLPAVLPATAEAVAEDAISLDHVAVIERVLAGLAPHLECHRPELESYLAGQARTFDPRELLTLGQRRIAFLDPDGPTPRDTPPSRNKISLAKDGDGWDVRGWFDNDSAAIIRTALSPLSGPRPAQDGERDTRTVAERTADGLIELALRQLAVGDLPSEGGERPHITITIGLDELESRLGNGLLDFAEGSVAGAISAENARRWACDARVTPIVLGGKSQPLDIGRRRRVVPRWIRRALHQRDGGCAFPGCTVAAQWCDAHHVIHWVDNGKTTLVNLVLLCGHHHTVLHRGEWTVTIVDDHPLFHPPPWIPGGPRRNTVHRIDLAPGPAAR